jgi:hypothetical protein
MHAAAVTTTITITTYTPSASQVTNVLMCCHEPTHTNATTGNPATNAVQAVPSWSALHAPVISAKRLQAQTA